MEPALFHIRKKIGIAVGKKSLLILTLNPDIHFISMKRKPCFRKGFSLPIGSAAGSSHIRDPADGLDRPGLNHQIPALHIKLLYLRSHGAVEMAVYQSVHYGTIA